MAKPMPAFITTHESKAHLARQAATDLGLAFQESPASSEEATVRFQFGKLSDDDTMKLLNAVPREAYCFKAIITG